MAFEYYANKDMGHSFPFERYRERSPYHPNEGESDYRRPYQPPKTPAPKLNGSQSDGSKNSHHKDYLTNDGEFIKMASTLLSLLPDNEQNGLGKRGEGVGIAFILQKLLSFDELKQFSNALHTRFQCLPRNPSSEDNQLIYIVRRCEKVFGREIRTLAQTLVSSQEKENDEELGQVSQGSQGQQVGNQGGKVTFSSPIYENEVRDEYSRVLDPTSFECSKKKEKPDGYDLTDHIVWEEKNEKCSPSKNDLNLPSGETLLTQQETASSASSDFTESVVYDMILDSKERNAHEIKSSKMKRDPNKDDRDEVSIASSYSASQSKTRSLNKSNRRIVNVVAPATLPENTMFEARLGDEVFMVHVPRGGVKRGQIFESNMLDIYSSSARDPSGLVKRFVNMGSPSMRWRDRLFDCFANGFFHPMLLNSICCPGVALAQVMSRMQLDIFGNKVTNLRSRINVDIVRVIPFVLLLLHGVLAFLMYRAFHLHVKGMKWIFAYSSAVVLAIDITVVGNIIWMTAKTRRFVRQEFNIPGSKVGDTLISAFCTSFAIAQMGRHTADYDTYVGVCCTNTGLPDQIEVKLPTDDAKCTIGAQV